MGNSAFQAAGSCLRPTLQLGGGRQTRVAPPGPALARSLQRGARYTTSCRAQRAGETRRRTGKRCPTLQGQDVEENPREEWLDRRENTLHIVPLSTEVSVKRAGRLGPQLVGRRVPE